MLADAKFSNLVASQTPRSDGGGVGAAHGADDAPYSLRHSIKSASSASEAQRFIACAIVEKVSQVLMVPIEDISPLRAISSYGGDSLTAVELRNWFVRSLDVNVGVMEILAGKSIEALAGDVTGRCKHVTIVETKEG